MYEMAAHRPAFKAFVSFIFMIFKLRIIGNYKKKCLLLSPFLFSNFKGEELKIIFHLVWVFDTHDPHFLLLGYGWPS